MNKPYRGDSMKFFCVSDIHGYFDEFKVALDAAGFDPDNESHWLIGCGDYFDRGRQPLEVMNYLKTLPRKILIQGNHEDLLEQCYSRRMAFSHDIHNGTAMTILDVGGDSTAEEFGDCCVRAGKRLQSFLDGMVNYFETKNYIFVHAWVPVSVYNWRDGSARDWDQSRWLNPFEMASEGMQADKTIVCGHWHCSAGWAKKGGLSEFGPDACFDPFFGDGFVAIDACTAHSHKVNILVLEDEFQGE